MWKEKFFEMYFNNEKYFNLKFKVIELKNKNIPSLLYKYTKAKYVIKILKNNLIKLSNISEFNDSYEGEIYYNENHLFEYMKSEIQKYFINDFDFKLTKK